MRGLGYTATFLSGVLIDRQSTFWPLAVGGTVVAGAGLGPVGFASSLFLSCGAYGLGVLWTLNRIPML